MRRHRTDGVSLSFGLIFLVVALWWAVAQVTTVRLPALGWLAAGALILFGVVGLLSAIRSGRRAAVVAPVQARAAGSTADETPGGLPPELHADIVRELLDNPADRPLPADPTSIQHREHDEATMDDAAGAGPGAPHPPMPGPGAPHPPVPGPGAAEQDRGGPRQ